MIVPLSLVFSLILTTSPFVPVLLFLKISIDSVSRVLKDGLISLRVSNPSFLFSVVLDGLSTGWSEGRNLEKSILGKGGDSGVGSWRLKSRHNRS